MKFDENHIFSIFDGPADGDSDEPKAPNAPSGLENDDKDPDEN